MSLNNNPFYILKLSCSASRREIMMASEEMGFVLDSEVCLEAQNSLINLSKRLNAEINWFINADNDTLENIRSSIENGELISTDELFSLSKLNATVFNFELLEADDSYELGYAILDIDEQFSGLDSYEITEEINANRLKGKIATIQEQDVVTELNNKRAVIRQSITEKLSALDEESYIELITMLAEKCIADEDYDDGVILSDVIDQYEVRMQSVLEESTEAIKAHIDRIKRLANDTAIGDNISSLIRRVQKWDTIAQPLQLKSQASGMPHEISEQLGRDLRNLALYLHNEKGKTNEALQLVDAMQEVFAELGDLSDLFESDSDALNDLIQGEKDAQEVVAELESLSKASESLKSYATSTSVENFISRVRKLDQKLKSLDLDSETRTKVRENLCLLARGTAIELHNTKHQTQYALNIAKALVSEFSDLPSLRAKLNEDSMTLSQQLLLSNRTIYPTRTYSSSSSSSKSSNSGCLVAIIVAVVIFIIIAIASSSGSSSGSKKTSSSPSTSYSQSSNSGNSSTTSSYTVTLNKDGGSGGSSSVSVKKGNSMPSATAPSKSGYIFKGYYSSKNGSGTKYYDSSMKSVHTWDQASSGTLYAYWEKKEEVKFSSSASAGDEVYADIVSIFPEIGIYTQGSTNYSNFVCRCKTSSGSTVWVYMTCSEYKSHFDSSASTSIYSLYADEKTFSSKRIHGIVKRAESIMSGLSSDTGTMVIDFSSVN